MANENPKMVIKVMADYHTSGLWVQEPVEKIGMIEHDALNVSQLLSDRIYKWIAVYDSWLNWDDPGHSPPTPIEEVRKFNEEGKIITRLLQKELGKKVEVFFKPEPESEI